WDIITAIYNEKHQLQRLSNACKGIAGRYWKKSNAGVSTSAAASVNNVDIPEFIRPIVTCRASAR
ncbi:hypothetical protein Tco_1513966, partial [Tanacetum coccineum]